jgi:uncharacterized membrane protein YkvA (DUF1232 family)
VVKLALCKNCGIEPGEKDKFCTHCGDTLTRHKEKKSKKPAVEKAVKKENVVKKENSKKSAVRSKKTYPISDFYEVLRDNVEGYEGELSEIIKYTPDFFKLLTNLLEDPVVPLESKPLINAAIAYFVAPFDALPEAIYGAVGYVDDLFLCAWTLKRLEERIGYAPLRNNWSGEEELSKVIDEVYGKSRETIKELEIDILEYVGLR